MQATITDVFFDLDHTLWDFEKNSALAFEKVLQEHASDVDLKLFLQHYVPINYQYWERYRKDEITQSELRLGRLRDTFDQIEYDIDEQQIELLSREYIRFLPQYNYLFDGAVEILYYLKSKYNLHIITNGFDEVQQHKINNSNIAHYFSTVTNSEMAGVKKPNPIIFEYALQKANTQKENSIMIGDCIEADVRGALQCGIDAILFCELSTRHDGIKQICHLSEIKKYL